MSSWRPVHAASTALVGSTSPLLRCALKDEKNLENLNQTLPQKAPVELEFPGLEEGKGAMQAEF